MIFNSLSKEDIHKIIDIELDYLYKRVNDLGYKIRLTEDAKDFLSDKGYDVNFGARPLKRAIQKYVEDPLAEEIIKAEMVDGDMIEITFDKVKDPEALKIVIVKPAKTRKKKEES